MIDRKNVIYGLHKTLGIIHMYVPKKSWGCGEQACRDAIELLEEQEDQEYVEPIPTPTDSSGWFFKCNKCSNPINWKDKFCSMCGKVVKWDD